MTFPDVFSKLRAEIERRGDPKGVPPVVVRPSRYAELEDALRSAEASSGFALPDDLHELYRYCDGFVDVRYSSLHGLERIIERLTNDENDTSLWIGDGSGMDEKYIYLVPGRFLKDGVAKIMFDDYLMPHDEDLNDSFRDRFTEEGLEAYGEHGEDGFTCYGPCTATELVEYVLETMRAV